MVHFVEKIMKFFGKGTANECLTKKNLRNPMPTINLNFSKRTRFRCENAGSSTNRKPKAKYDKQEASSFSQYVPLPAIGKQSAMVKKPKLLRENTYTVLNPVHVRSVCDVLSSDSRVKNSKNGKQNRDSIIRKTKKKLYSEQETDMAVSKPTGTAFWFEF